MAESKHLDWFRGRLRASLDIEPVDIAPILKWREQLLNEIKFTAGLIALSKVQGWGPDSLGNIVHSSGQFFSIEGVRVTNASLREVSSWDQPIYNQTEGGVLILIARENSRYGIQFLLQAKAEPGNIGWLQFCPSIQCSWSNLKRAHEGKRPALAELLLVPPGARLVYKALHNEEGSRFWRKSNENRIVFVSDESHITSDLSFFQWASLSQIKSLALIDNVVSPLVKSIVAPL